MSGIGMKVLGPIRRGEKDPAMSDRRDDLLGLGTGDWGLGTGSVVDFTWYCIIIQASIRCSAGRDRKGKGGVAQGG